MAKMPEGTLLRAGVAGAGVFGGIHAQKYEASNDAELTAVYDPDEARAQILAERYGARACKSYDEFLEQIDIATIAAPAAVHFDLGLRAIRDGRHVYMEKPLALSVAHAEELDDAARRADVIVQVGHQERLVVDAIGLFTDGAIPNQVEFARCGPSSGRCEDVSVVWDLMIHDLDLLARIGMGSLLEAHAVGDEHETTATLHFTGGRAASLIASRRCPERRRTMTARYDDGDVTLDFMERAIRSTRPFNVPQDSALARALADPLGAHVQSFLDAILGRKTTHISCADARSAVHFAEAVEAARLHEHADVDRAEQMLSS